MRCKTIYLFLVVFSLLIFTSVLLAQYGKVSGRVTDKMTKDPLCDVNIVIKGGGFDSGAPTDLDGYYAIIAVPPGVYQVVFSSLGYETIKVSKVEVEANLTTRLDEAMIPTILPNEVIEVEYEKPTLLPVYEEVTDPEPEQILSTELKRTVISAHMEVPIELGENIIYCSTFQIAWNMMQDSIIKEEILLDGDPEIARKLNKQLSTTKDISEDCYVAMAGFLTQEFLDEINHILKEKFGDNAPPEVVEPITLPTFFAYAYLFKNLEFEHVFKVSKYPLLFISRNDTANLKAFEVESQAQRNQVSVLDYHDDNDFIISLHSKSPNDEVILAKIPPQGTLLATIQLVQERMSQGSPTEVESDEPVKIPKCDFNVKHIFEELMGRTLKNTGWESWFISKAEQWIRFRLNEKGIVLKSEARLGMSTGGIMQIVGRRPRHFIFDKPFLICLKQKDAQYPYFAMWVDNAELMVKQ